MIGQEEKMAVVDLFPFMGDSPVIFDVGSNKGHWADIVLDEFKDKCQLHLFEPVEILLSFTKIKYEYKENVVFNNVLAYSEEKEYLKYYYFENRNNELSSIYDGGNDWEGLPKKINNCKCIRIDNYTKGHVDYIKIDCEGSDVEILQGCEKLLAENRVGIIQIEYSEHWRRGNHTWQELMGIVDKYGYKIYRYLVGNFWEEKSDNPGYDNYFLTKFEVHNYSIAGWNNNFILSVANLPKFDLILEVGAFEGLTTKYMCDNMLNEGGRVIVVDPLFDYYVKDDPRYHPEFKNQYQRFLRNTRGLPVELKRGKSDDELPKLDELKCDFCYIDGNHYPPSPYNDAINVFKMTKNGGYILFDDYDIWAQETKDSVDKFLDEYAPYIEIISKGYQCLIKKIIDP